MKSRKLVNLTIYILLLLIQAKSNRILIFTSNSNRLPDMHNLLSTYDFGVDGLHVEVNNVETPQ